MGEKGMSRKGHGVGRKDRRGRKRELGESGLWCLEGHKAPSQSTAQFPVLRLNSESQPRVLSKTYKKPCIRRCERRARGSKNGAQKMEIEERHHGEEELEIIGKLPCVLSPEGVLERVKLHILLPLPGRANITGMHRLSESLTRKACTVQ